MCKNPRLAGGRNAGGGPGPSARKCIGVAMLSLMACQALEPASIVRDGVNVGPIQLFEAERTHGVGGSVINDPSASDRMAIALLPGASAMSPMQFVASANLMVVRAHWAPCARPARLEVCIDDTMPCEDIEVDGERWVDLARAVDVRDGLHRLKVEHLLDDGGVQCAASLVVDRLLFTELTITAGADVDLASMYIPRGARIVDERHAGGNRFIAFDHSGSVIGEIKRSGGISRLSLWAKAKNACDDGADMSVEVDGVSLGVMRVMSDRWRQYSFPVGKGDERHMVSVGFVEATGMRKGCASGLEVGRLEVNGWDRDGGQRDAQ
jgi:hypothetical protein